MAKHAPSFTCQNCGAVYGRWAGKCEACGEWNTIADEGAARIAPAPAGRRAKAACSRSSRSRARRMTPRAFPPACPNSTA